MFSVKREREDVEEPQSAKRKALNGLVIGTGAVEQYGYAPANGGDAQGMDMEMGGEAGSSEYDQQLAWSGRMAHQASSASLNSAFSFASASGPATPSDYDFSAAQGNPYNADPNHSTFTNQNGQSFIFPTSADVPPTKESPHTNGFATENGGMGGGRQTNGGQLSVYPPPTNEHEARAFAEYAYAHGLPQAQLAMNGGLIQVVSPVDGFRYGADGTRELYSPSADYLRARYGVPSLLQNS